ncbi:hypothetical protein SETIT_1G053000v2 [Setaria italica]|uniref:B box-type domain-containing protein n=2 Tax=Setaria TaxID=4554 RepID=K3YYJ0_SETIT|nr:hypothetical protein SETIT_1G053000v2 [Setaria italica]TKW37521.1 hypothetical protein SEVIR_1G052100v2 [Setaria viridis]
MPSIKAMALADAERVPPAWLQPLLEKNFFEDCPNHPLSNCNFFCTVCSDRAICTGCLPDHPGHQVIQIRKLSGHGVVRVADVEALLNVSDVQPYLHNGHHVMFLNKRPMAGRGRAGEIRCEECERALLDVACRFCSIGCKLAALPEDLDFTVSFAVPPESDSESGGSDSDYSADGDRPSGLTRTSAQEGGEAGTSAASKPQTTVAAEPSSGQHRQNNNSVPKNI